MVGDQNIPEDTNDNGNIVVEYRTEGQLPVLVNSDLYGSYECCYYDVEGNSNQEGSEFGRKIWCKEVSKEGSNA